MASWRDGPEYAPLQRPDGFEVPDLAPLDDAPQLLNFSVGAPIERPQFSPPVNAVKSLAALAPDEGEPRDPQLPFAVAASTMTATDSAWSAAHWSRPAGIPVQGSWAPPTMAPAGRPAAIEPGSWPSAPAGPIPTDPIMMDPAALGSPASGSFGHPGRPPGPFPAAGSPQWFGPGPPAPGPGQMPADNKTRAVVEAATPVLLTVLVVSGLVYLLSPFLFCLAFSLSAKVRVAKVAIRRVFLALACFGGLMALLGLAAQLGSAWEWYRFVGIWALILSWVALILTLVIIHRAQQGPTRPQPPQYSHWG